MSDENDFSNKSGYQILKSDFRLIIQAVKDWLPSHQGKNPDTIFIRQNGKKLKQYITFSRYSEMYNRYTAFIHQNGKEPNYITIVYKSPNPPADPTSWILTGYFKQDFQDTDYTCGPTSLSMALSALGYSFTEQTLAVLAGTTHSGTGHPGLVAAAKKVAPAVVENEYYLSSVGGWSYIAQKLKAGCEFIIHLWTESLPNWSGAYGHYVFLTGVNLSSKQVRIFDPTKGDITYSFATIERAMNDISQKQSLQWCKT